MLERYALASWNTVLYTAVLVTTFFYDCSWKIVEKSRILQVTDINYHVNGKTKSGNNKIYELPH